MSRRQNLPSPAADKWLHLLAVLTTVCTFPLIFVGGLVTSRGAALAVPDWPTTYGENMFLFPLSKMVGGILYEHSHRLLGAFVGMMTVALAATAWLRSTNRAVRRLAGIALIAVCVQGVLGGLRVLLLESQLAIVHAVMAQTFFSLMIACAVVTSAGWRRLQPLQSSGPRLWPLAPVATGLIYGQLLLGAITRHAGAGVWAHIAGAAIVWTVVAAILIENRRCAGRPRWLRWPAGLMAALVVVQVVTGLWAMELRGARADDAPITALAAAIPTLHVAVGALILGTSIVLSLGAWKLLRDTTPALHRGPLVPAQSEVNA